MIPWDLSTATATATAHKGRKNEKADAPANRAARSISDATV